MDKKRQLMGGWVAWKFHSMRYNMQWRNTANLWLQAAALHRKHHFYCGVSPLFPIKQPADYTTNLILLWPFLLAILSNSLFGRMKLVFLSPQHTQTQSCFFFFFADISVFFAESIIKAPPPFSSMYRCQSLQFCSRAELMNINGWLSILFVQQHIQCRAG